jgi:hypothetical protein
LTGIKLHKLPDRTPVKLTVTIAPSVNRSLARYADFYRQTYHQDETAADLIAAIVSAFLESDRAFIRWCKDATDQNG